MWPRDCCGCRIENDGSLYAFETEISTPSHYRGLKLLRCRRRHCRDFPITVLGEGDNAARARELDERPCKVLDQKRTILLAENVRSSIRASRGISARSQAGADRFLFLRRQLGVILREEERKRV